MRSGIERAKELADIIELRLDCLDDANLLRIKEELTTLRSQAGCPLILTFRAPDQGGHGSAGFETRTRFWSSLKEIPDDCFVDIELDLVSKPSAAEFNWNQVICSHHDFKGVPANLTEIYDRLAFTPARILKIAVQANEAVDCLPVFALLERARSEGREMIAIAMGQSGMMTRVLAPAHRSFLTYGSLDDETATAPGQVKAADLRSVYRVSQIGKQTEVFGLIGKPVGHSLSFRLHNAALAVADIDGVYLTFETSDAAGFMTRMVHPRTRELSWNLRGLSVTTPHKSTVMPFLDAIAPAAAEIGAVNTIVIDEVALSGHNTDAHGFVVPLKRKLGSLNSVRCALIGAGGSARAVLWALRNEGAEVTVFARDPLKAKPVTQEFGADCLQLGQRSFGDFDVVINATPLGSKGANENRSVATAAQLAGVRLAYDLVYNPIDTLFLREARAAGCETLSGIEMLIAQAVEQFKLWTNREANVEVMRAALLAP
jgi:3-dehydroquinate dehydratase / shikimate dehydrogenase